MFKNYLKITLRNLAKNKSFSIINILGLAIGMSAFLLIFLYVTFELGYDNFHKNKDNIYRLRNDRVYKDIHDKSVGCPPALGPALKKEFPEVVEFARLYNMSYMGKDNIVSYNNNKTFNQDRVFFAEAYFLRIFSFAMVKGSAGSALEGPNTAVIARSTAVKYFGQEEPLGKTVAVTNDYGKQLFRITGVCEDVPENSHLKFELLLSYKTLVNLNKQAEYYWGWNAFNTYILLAPTADPQALQAKLPGFIKKYKISSEDYRREFILQPVRDIHLYSHFRWESEVNGDADSVYFLMMIALFVLLIAWVNYINLSTARSIVRAKEVGVRKVLGSRRGQLIKQFILESLVLNILAIFAALVMVNVSLPFFKQLTGKPLTLASWSGAYLYLAAALALGAVLAALYPAFILSSFNPVTVLKGKFSHSFKGINFRKFLVIFQFAISIILVAGTFTVYKQLVFMRNRDLGVNIDRALAVKIAGQGSNSAQSINRFKKEILDYPDIKGITASSTIPGKEYSNAASGIRPLNSNPEDGKRCFFISVDYEYFDFFGIKLSAGRSFSKTFSTDSNAIVLNEEAVKIFGYKNPQHALQQKILFGGLGGQIKETVGVIKNYHHKSLKDSLQPIIFSLAAGRAAGRCNYFSLKIDSKNLDRTISQIKNKWQQVFPGRPFEYFFLDESFDNQYTADRQFGKVFVLFALLAILVSCLGLFGLASFTAEQSTKEVGIRKVLGASAAKIVFLLSKEFSKWVLLANIIAWPLAYFAMEKWLHNFAYRTTMGIEIFILSGLLAFLTALLTVSYQAVKAASANPVDALKYE